MTDDRDDDKKASDRREPRLPSASDREDYRPLTRPDSGAPPLRPSAAMRTYMRPAKLQARINSDFDKPAESSDAKQRLESTKREIAPKPATPEEPREPVAQAPRKTRDPKPANDSHASQASPPPPPLPPSAGETDESHRVQSPIRKVPAAEKPASVSGQQENRNPERQKPEPEETAAPSAPEPTDTDHAVAVDRSETKKPGLAARLFGRRRKIRAERREAEDGKEEAGKASLESGHRDQPAQPPLPEADANVERLPPRPVKVKPQPRLVLENVGLEIRSLGKHFKKRPVLRDVSLRVQRGEAVGLLGPNGAGKTTCFYIVTGLIPADYGEIFLDGQDITSLPMYRRARMGIGYLPQEASIFRGLTVEQNIRAVLELVEKDLERRETALESLLAEFSISHLRRTPAIALSGGERRRLEIARALASQPNFILLDEPLAGIDPIAVRDIRDLVSHLKDRGIGVLITDHNVRETLEIVDRAYILHDGNVLMEGPPADIVANQEVRRVYLGDRFTL